MIIEKCCVCKKEQPIAMCVALKVDDELCDLIGLPVKILYYDFCLDCGSKLLESVNKIKENEMEKSNES